MCLRAHSSADPGNRRSPVSLRPASSAVRPLIPALSSLPNSARQSVDGREACLGSPRKHTAIPWPIGPDLAIFKAADVGVHAVPQGVFKKYSNHVFAT